MRQIRTRPYLYRSMRSCQASISKSLPIGRQTFRESRIPQLLADHCRSISKNTSFPVSRWGNHDPEKRGNQSKPPIFEIFEFRCPLPGDKQSGTDRKKVAENIVLKARDVSGALELHPFSSGSPARLAGVAMTCGHKIPKTNGSHAFPNTRRTSPDRFLTILTPPFRSSRTSHGTTQAPTGPLKNYTPPKSKRLAATRVTADPAAEITIATAVQLSKIFLSVNPDHRLVTQKSPIWSRPGATFKIVQKQFFLRLWSPSRQ